MQTMHVIKGDVIRKKHCLCALSSFEGAFGSACLPFSLPTSPLTRSLPFSSPLSSFLDSIFLAISIFLLSLPFLLASSNHFIYIYARASTGTNERFNYFPTDKTKLVLLDILPLSRGPNTKS